MALPDGRQLVQDVLANLTRSLTLGQGLQAEAIYDWQAVLENTTLAETAYRLYQREKGYHPLLRTMGMDASCRQIRRILASTDPDVLELICDGNLCQAMQNDAALEDRLCGFMKRVEEQPSIYMFELIRQGSRDPITPNEMERILRVIEVYADKPGAQQDVDKTDLINAIDNVKKNTSNSETRGGMRRYYEGVDWKSTVLKNLADFVGHTRYRLDKVPANERDVPTEAPYKEVGFAKNSKERMEQQKKHQGSNAQMSLVSAIIHTCWPNQFEFVGTCIYLIWEPEQGHIAEVVFSVLASSYVKTGYGFNGAPAGGSNHAMFQSTWDWLTASEATAYLTNFVARMREDDRKVKKLQDMERELGTIHKRMKARQLEQENRINDVMCDEIARLIRGTDRKAGIIEALSLAIEQREANPVDEDAEADLSQYEAQLAESEDEDEDSRRGDVV